MKKLMFQTFLCIASVILITVLVVGCNFNERNEVEPLDSTSSTVQITNETTINNAHTTTVMQSTTTTQAITDKPTPIYLYERAVKDYLLPIEEFSWDRVHAPEFVMLHFTSAVVKHRDDPYNMEYIRDTFIEYDVSVHYIVERDGTIRCYIPEDRVAWHAGKGEFGGDPKYTDSMNHYAIGIEIVGMGSESDMSIYLSSKEYAQIDDSLKGFTDEQYTALKALVDDICKRYGIPKDRAHIIGHEEYASRKNDPGELFEWDKVVD